MGAHMLSFGRRSHSLGAFESRQGPLPGAAQAAARLGGGGTPRRMAAPAHYNTQHAYASAGCVIEAILGSVAGEDDTDELSKVAALQRCLHAARCRDAGDLLLLHLTEWNAHVREAGWEHMYVSGVVRCILKFLGPRGTPHVPPGATGVACECRMCTYAHTTKPSYPAIHI